MGPWSFVDLSQDRSSENNAGKQFGGGGGVGGQIIGLSTQYHLHRRYLFNSEMPVLHREVPDCYSL